MHGRLWTQAFFLVKSFASTLRLHSPDSTRTTIMPGLKHLLQNHDGPPAAFALALHDALSIQSWTAAAFKVHPDFCVGEGQAPSACVCRVHLVGNCLSFLKRGGPDRSLVITWARFQGLFH
jgi:hypothetical protein